jgi:8-oxo-dGTP pyrophosphatase MutT (NUDIX family)
MPLSSLQHLTWHQFWPRLFAVSSYLWSSSRIDFQFPQQDFVEAWKWGNAPLTSHQFHESPFAKANAAVTIMFYPKENLDYGSQDLIPHVLLFKKKLIGRHGGQIAFPGGLVEKEDVSLFETARREMKEEVGLISQSHTYSKCNNGRSLQVIGILPNLFKTDTTRMRVASFVGVSESPIQNISENIDREEVETVMEVPLSSLCCSKSFTPSFMLPPHQPNLLETHQIQTAAENMPQTYNGPLFCLQNIYGLYPNRSSELPVVVWGLTARILFSCLKYLVETPHLQR